jgi:3-hydroxy-9,10-secoandrosta-1,3,5(10)-triene-9,17-dione monooxygenase reductase component
MDESQKPATPSGDSPRPDGLAAALGAVPSGLFVVTTGVGDAATGFLASFVQQIGFEPPALTVAVRSDRVLERMRSSGAFCVNVLAQDDREHLVRFAKGPPATDPFEDLAIVPCDDTGVPALVGTVAQIECRVIGEQATWSDHVLVCGAVVAGRRPDGSPAVHVRRNGLSY